MNGRTLNPPKFATDLHYFHWTNVFSVKFEIFVQLQLSVVSEPMDIFFTILPPKAAEFNWLSVLGVWLHF